MASKIVCFHKLHLKFVCWLAYVIGKQQEFHEGLQHTGLVLSVPRLPNLSRHKDLLGQSPTHIFWNSNLIHFQTAVTERIACTLLNYFSLLIRYWAQQQCWGKWCSSMEQHSGKASVAQTANSPCFHMRFQLFNDNL